MALTVISGEIAAQPLNDNFSEGKANLDTHKAESALKHITESGSNANGRYIKFDDGTMICTGFVTLVYASATILQVNWTLPSTFIGIPRIYCTVSEVNEANVSDYNLPAGSFTNVGIFISSSKTTTSSNVKVYSPAGTFVTGNYVVAAVEAIGMWK